MPFPRRFKLIIGVLLAAVAVAGVFAPSLRNGFVNWGDDDFLIRNVLIRFWDVDHLRSIFTTAINGLYFPLTLTSFAVEYHYVQLNPFVYHLTNVLFHLANTLLVYVIVHRLGVGFIGSAIAGLLFGIHPMHVESVAWVSGRQDVLFSFFYLLSILTYLRYQFALKRSKKGLDLIVGVYVLGLFSMLSSPMALSLPFILILLDWYEARKLDKRTIVEKAPMLVLFLLLAGATFISSKIVFHHGLEKIGAYVYAFIFYLIKFVYVGHLKVIEHFPSPIWVYVISFVALVGLCFLTYVFRKNRDLVFGLSFYAISIFCSFIVNGLVSPDSSLGLSSHLMYLPSMGLCLYAAKIVEDCWLNRNPRRYFINRTIVILASTAVCVFSLQSFEQVKLWRNGFTLWNSQLNVEPDDPVALNNLADFFRDTVEYRRAQAKYAKYLSIGGENIKSGLIDDNTLKYVQQVKSLYEQAIKADPSYEDAYLNLGNFYLDVGKPKESLGYLQKALDIDPHFKQALLRIGDAYMALGESIKTVEFYNQALKFYPKDEDVHLSVALAYNEFLKKENNSDYEKGLKDVIGRMAHVAELKAVASSYFNLGYLYGEMGDLNNAKTAYEKALKINPRYADALYNLGNVYKDAGRWEDALNLYQKVVDIEPMREEAYLNIGVIYNRLSRFSDATNYFKKALEVDPRDGKAYFNLAYISEVAGNFEDAIHSYQMSTRLDPENAEGYYNLGNVYVKTRKNKEALVSYLKAVEINPNHINAWINLSIVSFQEKDYKNAVKYCDEAILLGYTPEEGYRKALEPYRGK